MYKINFLTNKKSTVFFLISTLLLTLTACVQQKPDIENQQQKQPKLPDSTPIRYAPKGYGIIWVGENKSYVMPNSLASNTTLYISKYEDECDITKATELKLPKRADDNNTSSSETNTKNFVETELLKFTSVNKINYFWKHKNGKKTAKDGTTKIDWCHRKGFATGDIPNLNQELETMPQVYQNPVLNFKDKLYFIGNKNKILASEDAIKWQEPEKFLETIPENIKKLPEMEWSEAVVFKNKIYIIGGKVNGDFSNEIWYSEDGINWIQEKPKTQDASMFSPRWFVSATVFKDKIYLVGGWDKDGYKNDVWTSNDGINWSEQKTTNPKFKPIIGHKIIGFNNKIYLTGGFSKTNGNEFFNDIWSSADGKDWIKETLTGDKYTKRYAHTLQVFDNKLWLLGGTGDVMGTTNFNDIYSSTDGKNWKKEKTSDENAANRFSPRRAHAIEVFQARGDTKKRMYILGGHIGKAFHTYARDVWRTENGINWEKGFIFNKVFNTDKLEELEKNKNP